MLFARGKACSLAFGSPGRPSPRQRRATAPASEGPTLPITAGIVTGTLEELPIWPMMPGHSAQVNNRKARLFQRRPGRRRQRGQLPSNAGRVQKL